MQAAGMPTTFEQTGAGDTTPPALESFSITPSTVDTSSSSQNITVTAHITDDLAGNAGPGYFSSPSQVRFVGPSGKQSVWTMLDGTRRISGTAQDGVYQATMTVPQYAEQGTWTVQGFLLVDQAGNSRNLTAADMQAAGMPTTFTNG
jgi:serine protease